ncbi:excinuclease ABC subunit A [Candidatus Curtissbacteria bacterium RIFCSPHIGHO2_01_FULL_41_44]|uniref:UvrABC system protein A n=1 Tax=Candidatus Curtissbacteria bacterium RIFCSPLOWO2_01_FULL_42_50 TaxID=1797730 RepID=A0A1F5H4H5_9BACT|nr:MAG: excinuclease ABC subunit A [Candidatus Curtissbacteria bacterium RIFCSPHIGHO2_01_FULL_41_44]OGD93230.1 MAG: excinuclease ABC subunit A [Candidatus Curtissbacteria bacterium RIFCSPHIGHO2_02_FULL_42_58]OGD96870.1 MAG: excinuclease ABC subunit A [Candidatus Curtissbacteria bacterium RIFCSPHIGHO2_12_FULL_42_33]OGD98934.1 MAG: excinuclease ABC subunit A [Candidatus Curtissbacteria bacterium RIFCSPLOWO2_01_FULL_42_50]OGE03478.1 MAG: excinuclease ABC subunit A [Candidatus Curtissbacteria bacte
MDKIIIKGARVHNLKNINVTIPKNKLVVFTGISGSGKSSLAFDTIYAEGQRRYVESLSAYARQFLGIMDKPDVDSIEGLSPAISIDQKSASHNPRSTVGTVTEIYDYLRLLFARIGHPHCPYCSREIARSSPQQIAEEIQKLQTSNQKPATRILLLAPVVRDRKGEFRELFIDLTKKGYRVARIDNRIKSLDEEFVLIKTNKHTIEVVIDRLTLPADKTRLIQSVEQGLKLSDGTIIAAQVQDKAFEIPQFPQKLQDHLFSQKFACPFDNISLPEIEPRTFSFNSPHGACPTCNGLGSVRKVDPELILNPNLSIAEGGILPWARIVASDTWQWRVLETVCFTNHIPMDVALGKLPNEAKNILLYGSRDQYYTVKGPNRFGRIVSWDTDFEGLIPNLERKYSQTESDYVRAEIEKFMWIDTCTTCHGTRLKTEALSITTDGKSIADITRMSISDLASWLTLVADPENTILSEREKVIAKIILRELKARVQFLVDVGLEYLTVERPAATLAGGEAQRIRLASQIGSGLSGVLYVLDEPSIGLHQRDNHRLITTLKRLRDLKNTVIVVEHDRDMMISSDEILDFGPGAGEHGGQIIAQGNPKQIMANTQSLTGKYLSGKKRVEVLSSQFSVLGNYVKPEQLTDNKLTIVGAREHNLKNITVEFPLGKFICITGVSGSGKSTLIHDILYNALAERFYRSRTKPGDFDYLSGFEHLDKVILIDQSPIGRTPRSNPATYTGVFTPIRELFSKTTEARIRGYKPGRFSFNVRGGRCEACEGEGQVKIEMQFLPDVYIDCEVCQGKRYDEEVLSVNYKGKNIAQVLAMTVEEALTFFENIPQIKQKLETIYDIGLGYIRLGQSAPTLSGGEAQRVKLATELSKRATGKTLYILDEPTTGLHFADIERLLAILKRLVVSANTVIVIEHNIDVIKNTDWIIDLGPEGGDEGGRIVACGTPYQVSKTKSSYTGQFLGKVLAAKPQVLHTDPILDT